ncbi:hypothetical protein P9239_10435 [Caballeronia sp. LZ062]|nr:MULTISPECIES: hypothetical protein [unclassified Caballeronia]MDR5854710.1 hypothetical protein [Caballeronia sp. LZ050]MDR5870761.1 hypothetical protein [Caballeronia sp. LZ062]
MQPAIECDALKSDKCAVMRAFQRGFKRAGKNNECFGAHAVPVAGFSGPR